MTALVQLREAPLIAFSDDIIDYEEFLILYELNISREICPIVFFDKFDLSAWNETFLCSSCDTAWVFGEEFQNFVYYLTKS